MARTDPEVAQVWDQFHAAVNMTSPELRDWLLTTPDGGDAYASEPDVDVRALGEHVLRILDKRRSDVTDADVAVMRQVVDLVTAKLANPPADDALDRPWRDSLLTLGHDPTRADSPRGVDLES